MTSTKTQIVKFINSFCVGNLSFLTVSKLSYKKLSILIITKIKIIILKTKWYHIGLYQKSQKHFTNHKFYTKKISIFKRFFILHQYLCVSFDLTFAILVFPKLLIFVCDSFRLMMKTFKIQKIAFFLFVW